MGKRALALFEYMPQKSLGKQVEQKMKLLCFSFVVSNVTIYYVYIFNAIWEEKMKVKNNLCVLLFYCNFAFLN